MAKIGFVGLGHMGLPMALNLLKAENEVIGFDIQSESLRQFSQHGAQVARDLSELQDVDVLITMLQTGDQVREVCLGAKGLLAVLHSQSLYVDCSSIDVVSSRLLTKVATEHGLDAVDAPVSGGVAGAAAATLTFMVGGEQRAFERALPILLCMGKKVIHAGEAGSGQVAKICNNMILGVSMIAVSEAFILSQQLGMKPEKLFEIVNAASGQCWVMSHYVPVSGVLADMPADHDYEPGFTAQMMLKDLRLSQACAKEAGVKTPMGALANNLYEKLNQDHQGSKDFSAIIQWLSKEKGGVDE